jgi:hypothetical protein
MKKNMLVIRFGTPVPLPKEVKLVNDKIVAPEDIALAVGSSFHGMGVASIFRTSLTAKEIALLFEDLAKSTGDILPVIVQDLDDEGFSLPAVSGFDQMVADYRKLLEGTSAQPQPTVQHNMSLDDLLDLANRKGGVSKLSADEMQLLEKLSKNL